MSATPAPSARVGTASSPCSPTRRDPTISAAATSANETSAIRLAAQDLWLEFGFSSGYLEAENQAGWTSSGKSLNLIEGKGANAAKRITTEVTPDVGLLPAMASASLSSVPRRALRQALGLSDDEHFRKTYLLPTLNTTLIEMTIPDKPTSRLQKCWITEAGRSPGVSTR